VKLYGAGGGDELAGVRSRDVGYLDSDLQTSFADIVEVKKMLTGFIQFLHEPKRGLVASG